MNAESRGNAVGIVWEDTIDGYLAYTVASGSGRETIRLRRHYLGVLARHCCPTGPWQATVDQLTAVLATPGWAPETRKSARSSLRSFYRWGVDTGKTTTDPARALPQVRVPLGAPRPTPRDVVTQALARADERGRLMLLLALLAGLRRAEIAAVHSTHMIHESGEWSLRVVGKGQRVRVVPLHPLLAETLLEYRCGFLFPGKDHGHLSADRVGRIIADLLGPGWTAHTLRHRFSTECYSHTHDLFATQQLLGHSRPETTQRYTQVPDDSLRAAVLSFPGGWTAA
jgi:integrase/recombinase XerC